MRDPPDLSTDAIVAAVRSRDGIPAAGLAFLPIGHDSSAWVYRVHADDGGDYFLKVRSGPVNEAGLRVSRYVQDRGVTQVVAPIPTVGGELWAGVDGFTLTLYPFIDGRTGMDGGMAERHWTTFGAVLARVHAMRLAPELAGRMRRESYTPAWSDVVWRVDAHIAGRTFEDPAERELAELWSARRTEIQGLVERAEALGERLRAAALPLVLCHADAHTANVLIDTSDRIWIVDWDETVLAPRERDLMFVVGGISATLVGPREEGWFFRGYGATAVDVLALAYYRYAWAVNDIGAYGEQALLLPGRGAATKRTAVQGLMSLFKPGQIVSLAYAADRPGI